jgi:hypothetical protein
MKNNFTLLLVLFLLFHLQIKAQLTQAFARGNVARVSYQHLELAGEKILVIDSNYVNWTLLNLDNTVFGSGTLPTVLTNDFSFAMDLCTATQNKLNILATQTLFNSDSQVEFLYSSSILNCYSNMTQGYNYIPKVLIFDSGGNIIFYKTKYRLENIFNTTNSSLMILKQDDFDLYYAGGTYIGQFGISDSILVYNLPGQLNCSNCNLNNPVSNLINHGSDLQKSSFNVFPNPFNENVSIEYTIPKNSINPLIEIFDALGKSIKKINLQDTEGKLVLNSTEFSKGIYFYVISANGEIFQDRKMIKFE